MHPLPPVVERVSKAGSALWRVCLPPVFGRKEKDMTNRYDCFSLDPDDGFFPVVDRNFARLRAEELADHSETERRDRLAVMAARAGFGLSVCVGLFFLASALAGGGM